MKWCYHEWNTSFIYRRQTARRYVRKTQIWKSTRDKIMSVRTWVILNFTVPSTSGWFWINTSTAWMKVCLSINDMLYFLSQYWTRNAKNLSKAFITTLVSSVLAGWMICRLVWWLLHARGQLARSLARYNCGFNVISSTDCKGDNSGRLLFERLIL